VPRDELLRDLGLFGPPLYVPVVGAWEVIAVEQTNDVHDAVLVFGHGGQIEVRTESSARQRQPISIRVENVQHATAHTEWTRREWTGELPDHRQFIVEEVEGELVVDGEPHAVRVLQSFHAFGVELELGDRVVSAGGRLSEFDRFALARLDDLSDLPPDRLRNR
jgi:hypothetical protein